MFIKELLRHWTYQVFAPGAMLRSRYESFKSLLALDERCLELISELEDIFYGGHAVDWGRVVQLCRRIEKTGRGIVKRLIQLGPARYVALAEYYEKIVFYMNMELDLGEPDLSPPYALPLEEAAGRPEIAGGKASSLATVASQGDFLAPPGLVVTASAFHYLLDDNGLRPTLDRLLSELSLDRPESFDRNSAEIREMILGARIPDAVMEALSSEMDVLVSKASGKEGFTGAFSVRSSAVAEDGELSFAGQYDSLLEIGREEVEQAYLSVLASKYSSRALTYRILNGVADMETPMAVLIQPMIDAVQAGVVYSRDMDRSQSVGGIITIYAVDGPGDGLVSGSKTPSIISMDRGGRPETLLEGDGVRPLSHQAAFTLARQAQILEALFDTPQDIEWALDGSERIWILQSRPMQGDRPQDWTDPDLVDPVTTAPPFVEGGMRVSGGHAVGETFHAATVQELENVPDKAILLSPTLSPSLVQAMNRLSGVIAATGSRAGHFASVAREFGLPVTVVGPKIFETLTPGQEVFLDADRGEIYHAGDLANGEALSRAPRRRTDTATTQRLKRILPHVAKLNLIDPKADNFRPEGCRSVHDVVRYAHEQALEEMFNLVGRSGRGLAQSVRVSTTLPIALYVLDLGGGLFEHARNKKEITPEDFTSSSMWTVWWGLTDEQVEWSGDTLHVDWEAFDRISAGIFKHDSRLLASYAILSDDYLHLLIRFGYHFAVLDSLCSASAEKNHIRFRFKGGGGSQEQRMLRLNFIKAVLDSFDFETRVTGDMLDAVHARGDETSTLRRLAVMGKLLAVTRLMDVALDGDEAVCRQVDEFLGSVSHPPYRGATEPPPAPCGDTE